MPIFRPHSISMDLMDSLRESKIVKNKQDILYIINKTFYYQGITDELEIKPYPDDDDCFDHRIGWFTQMVRIKTINNTFIVVGYLSEPLQETKEN